MSKCDTKTQNDSTGYDALTSYGIRIIEVPTIIKDITYETKDRNLGLVRINPNSCEQVIFRSSVSREERRQLYLHLNQKQR